MYYNAATNSWLQPLDQTGAAASDPSDGGYAYDVYGLNGQNARLMTLLITGVNTTSDGWWFDGSVSTDNNGNQVDVPNGNQYLPAGASVPIDQSATGTAYLPTDTSFPMLTVGGDCSNYFGDYYTNYGATSLLGNIDEILCFNRPLSTSERYTVESYLSQKYNLQTTEFTTGLPNGVQ
jgi:hypothetical protein